MLTVLDFSGGRSKGASIVLFAFVVLASILTFARPIDARQMRASITFESQNRDVRRYRIDVIEAGDPVSVDVGAEASEADLSIAGTTYRRVGRDVPLGVAPLGHATTLMSLAGLDRGARVELKIVRGAGIPTIATDVAESVTSFRAGYLEGGYLAILCVVALFNIVTVLATRDAATLWYIGFVASTFGGQLVREGFILSGSPNAGAVLLGTILLAGVGLVGFGTCYLQLWSTARRAMWFGAVGVLGPMVLVVGYAAITRAPVDNLLIVVPVLFSLASLGAIAIYRRIRGFRPATFMLLGILGLFTVFALKIWREATGAPSPFLDRFGFEFGMSFDVLVLSIGIVYRGRYVSREYARIQRELAGATYDAHHDPLTGLLNRRGLDALMNDPAIAVGTVLFVDIDGFKRVNDVGGHKLGDSTLSEIGRRIKAAVREQDVVARVGGDEFVIVLRDLANDRREVRDIALRVRDGIASHRPITGVDLRIDASIGIGEYGDATALVAAIDTADRDAYRVKSERAGVGR